MSEESSSEKLEEEHKTHKEKFKLANKQIKILVTNEAYNLSKENFHAELSQIDSNRNIVNYAFIALLTYSGFLFSRPNLFIHKSQLYPLYFIIITEAIIWVLVHVSTTVSTSISTDDLIKRMTQDSTTKILDESEQLILMSRSFDGVKLKNQKALDKLINFRDFFMYVIIIFLILSFLFLVFPNLYLNNII